MAGFAVITEGSEVPVARGRRLFLKGCPNLSNRGHERRRTFIRNHVAAVGYDDLLSSRGKTGFLGL